jgi:hypothetical protein
MRLGITLSVIWVLGSSAYWLVQISRCTPNEPWLCDFIVANSSGTSAPFWALPNMLGFWQLGLWGNVLFATLVFPVLVWATIWIAILAAQWIRAGRQISN